MKIVVTGAAGFIGVHVAQSLIESGHEVVGVDCFTAFHALDLKERRWLSLVHQPVSNIHNFDVADDDHFTRLVSHEMPDAIVHLAAMAGIRYAARYPEQCLRSNVTGSYKVFDAAALNEIPRVIYASSSSVYGNVTDECREDDLTAAPVSIYGASKLSSEIIARSFSATRGLSTIGARFFTAYGAWGRPDMAYFRLLVAALTDTEFPILADLSHRRDFTHVSDVVNVLTRVVDPAFEAHDDALVVNVGGGVPCSLADLMSTVESVTGRRVRTHEWTHTIGDAVSTNASTVRLTKLGLPVPQVDLRHGIEMTAAWMIPLLDDAVRWSEWTRAAEVS
jgi:UDP-glucuronate 4-epimerase